MTLEAHAAPRFLAESAPTQSMTPSYSCAIWNILSSRRGYAGRDVNCLRNHGGEFSFPLRTWAELNGQRPNGKYVQRMDPMTLGYPSASCIFMSSSRSSPQWKFTLVEYSSAEKSSQYLRKSMWHGSDTPPIRVAPRRRSSCPSPVSAVLPIPDKVRMMVRDCSLSCWYWNY